jgi:hypothetical protein
MHSLKIIDPVLLNTRSPAVHKLLYALRKEMMLMSDKQRKHRSFHFLVTGEMTAPQSVSDWAEQVTVRNQIKTTQRMLPHHKLQLAQAFNGVGSRVQTGINTQHCGTFRQDASASGSNSWFQLVPKRLTLGSVPNLALVYPQNVSLSIFSPLVQF